MAHVISLSNKASVILTEKGARRINEFKGRESHKAGEVLEFDFLFELFLIFGGDGIAAGENSPFFQGTITVLD